MSFPSSLAATFLFRKLCSLLLGLVREKRDGKGGQKEKYFVVHKQKQTVALPKQVVLTTEWLPWLHTRWRDSSSENFTVVCKTDCIKQPRGMSILHNHNTLTTLRTYMHAKKYSPGHHNVLRVGSQYVVVVR